MSYKILIVAPAWVGDTVMSQTLFKLLKTKYGDNLILDIFANQWASGLLSRMPEISSVIINPFGHGKLELIKRIKVGISLRHKEYNEVIVLPNSIKSAIVPFFARISLRTGFVGEGRYLLLNQVYKLDKTKLPLMIDRFCALGNNGKKPDLMQWPELTRDNENQKRLIDKFSIDSTKTIIAFCPAAEYGPAKRWFPEHFAALADKLDNCEIIILGSHKDVEISDKIMQLAKNKAHLHDICGKTNLLDAIDLLAAAKSVVTNDSGLMHIACAVGTSVIALFGSSSPSFTPPLSKNAQIIQVDLECSPCFQRACRFGHYNCLKFITPEMVIKQMQL